MKQCSRTLALARVHSLPFASCASIITGSTDRVTINSSPQGASFTTNSGDSGFTPSKIVVADDLDLEVHYSLPGYQDADVTANSRMSAWIFGNILIGGLIGLAIDLITGNYKTHAGEVSVTLRPVQG